LQTIDLAIHILRDRVDRTGDREAGGAADRVAEQITSAVHPGEGTDQADGVDVVDRGGVGVVADVRRVAGNCEDGPDSHRVSAEELRLQSHHVPVATREVGDALDADLLLHEVAAGDRAYPESRPGT